MNFDIDKEDIINMIVADTIRGILAALIRRLDREIVLSRLHG